MATSNERQARELIYAEADPHGMVDAHAPGRSPLPPTCVDVGVMLEAMAKCADYYHQSPRLDFYGRMAEEYSTITSDVEDVSVEDLEMKEEEMKRLALAIAQPYELSVKPPSCPPDVRPHLKQILVFYKSVGVLNDTVTPPEHKAMPDVINGMKVTPPPPSPSSPSAGIHKADEHCHTDGSASDIATPVVEDRGDGPTNDGSRHGQSSHDQEQEVDQDTSVAAPGRSDLAAVSGSQAAPCLRDRPPAHPKPSPPWQIHDIFRKLVQEQERARERVRTQEARVAEERRAIRQLKQEYKKQKATLKDCKQRERERRRVQCLLDARSVASIHTRPGASDGEIKRAKKQRKELKRFQKEMALKFQLAQSESQRFEMVVEKQMADLRREYSDSYLFPDMNSFS